jgi:catalase
VHNNQRDGLHRQAIPRGRVAYEPNSLGGGCPFQAGAAGFVSFPQPIEDQKLRGKPEKFADHYTQASLFYESQTDVEKAHIAGGFRFELSKVSVPAIRERMVASLVNVSEGLAAAVAAGLGMALPKALPRALARPAAPEVVISPALSLKALPGDGGIRTRKVAILAADGADGASIMAMASALSAVGAVACVIGARLGRVNTLDRKPLEASATLENSPPVLFDALVLADGVDGVTDLARHVQTMDFIREQYRHGKTILALGASKVLLDRADISATLPSGERDPGILLARAGEDASAAFIAAVGKQRHTEREAALLRD